MTTHNEKLVFNLTKRHDFFFRVPSAKFNKKKLSVGMLIITWTWNEQKRITNGEQRHFGVPENAPPPGDKGGFWGKIVEKKWKSYMQGWFWKKKTKNRKFYMQGFQYIIFKKYLFSPIYKGDYLATFDFKVCFFSLLQIWYLGQNAFLEIFFSKKAKNQLFRIGVTLWIFFKFSQKSAIWDRGNPMNFVQN